jgi:hypothetical protein
MDGTILAIVTGPPHPTSPDVDRLVATLDYTEGHLLSHAEIAEAIGTDKGSGRYQTVVDSWKRRMLRDRNIDLRCIRGEGYRVLLPGERVTHGADLRHSGVKRLRFGQRVLRGVDTKRLTEAERATWDHEAKTGAAIIAIGRAGIKQVSEEAKRKALTA